MADALRVSLDDLVVKGAPFRLSIQATQYAEAVAELSIVCRTTGPQHFEKPLCQKYILSAAFPFGHNCMNGLTRESDQRVEFCAGGQHLHCVKVFHRDRLMCKALDIQGISEKGHWLQNDNPSWGDWKAMTITAHPITGMTGAEITGVDLGAPISTELGSELRAQLSKYLVLVFQDQHLDVAAQKRLTAVFGMPMQLPYIVPMVDEPEVVRVLKEADDRSGVFGGDWHSDLSFIAEPPAGSILNAVELPPYGGDTLFANQVAAWDALSPGLKDLLDGRDAIHVGKPHGVKWAPPLENQARGAVKMVRGDSEADKERYHPAVLCDPVAGQKSLYLNPIYVTRLEGMTEGESRPVLDMLKAHSTRPEFCMRLRWKRGSVAVWNNYATLHFAVNDYFGFRREMWRTTFRTRPFADWRGTV